MLRYLTAALLFASVAAQADPLPIPPGRNIVAYHGTDNVIFATIAEDGKVTIDWAVTADTAKNPSNSGSAAVAKLLLAARGAK